MDIHFNMANKGLMFAQSKLHIASSSTKQNKEAAPSNSSHAELLSMKCNHTELVSCNSKQGQKLGETDSQLPWLPAY